MKYLRSFFPAVIIASTVVAEEPIAAKYFAEKVTTDNGYTQALLLPNGTLEYVVAFTTVADETNPHTWQVPAGIKEGIINYLVVAGGGGGGTGSNKSAGGGGGGGGAGGMLTGTLTSISESTDLEIVVGAGGTGGSSGKNVANNGANSYIKADGVIDEIIAIGGGAGGSGYSDAVSSGSYGGSGGGAAGTGGGSAATATTGGTCAEGQGFVGGDRTSSSQNRPGAGGGGAGEAGITITTANTTNRGHGGDGKYSYITGAQVRYAGGGGGGTYGNSNDINGLGGAGGGGAGGNYNKAPLGNGVSGTASTGGGGGGARGYRSGGSGGSGIVVLRYALNDDDFQGIVIDSTTEKFGSPDIAYGLYTILPSSGEYTFPRFSDVSDGVRAVCVGCELWNKDETELIDEYADDYRDNQSTADTVQYAIGENKGVVLKWKLIKEYYVSTVASCERGSLVADKSGWYREGDTIQVAITSMDNFIGWGGWGDGSQRSIEPSKTITVVAAPMTITAYFTAKNKDNLVVNGDFELNNDSSHTKTIIQNFNRLIAGCWRIVQSKTAASICSTGILAAQSSGHEITGIKVYGGSGLSLSMAADTYSTGRKDAIIETDIKVTNKGQYKFSCIGAAGYHSNRVNYSKWVINVLLIDERGNEISLGQMQHQYDKNQVWNKQYESYCMIRKTGIYKLRFVLPISSIVDNDPSDGKSPQDHAHSALDNIRFCLDKVYGLSVIVR